MKNRKDSVEAVEIAEKLMDKNKTGDRVMIDWQRAPNLERGVWFIPAYILIGKDDDETSDDF